MRAPREADHKDQLGQRSTSGLVGQRRHRPDTLLDMRNVGIILGEKPPQLHTINDVRTSNDEYWSLCNQRVVIAPGGEALDRCEDCDLLA